MKTPIKAPLTTLAVCIIIIITALGVSLQLITESKSAAHNNTVSSNKSQDTSSTEPGVGTTQNGSQETSGTQTTNSDKNQPTHLTAPQDTENTIVPELAEVTAANSVSNEAQTKADPEENPPKPKKESKQPQQEDFTHIESPGKLPDLNKKLSTIISEAQPIFKNTPTSPKTRASSV